MSYLVWKVLHVLSVVVFLGNVATGFFWAARADRSGDFGRIAATFDTIIASDRWLTLPGVAGILVTGIAGAMAGGLPILGTGWILWPVLLFLLSGALFSARVAPLQREIAARARAGDSSGYRALYRRWRIWGQAALAAPLVALVIMVLKPALPAF